MGLVFIHIAPKDEKVLISNFKIHLQNELTIGLDILFKLSPSILWEKNREIACLLPAHFAK